MIVIVVIFATVPVLIYDLLDRANSERNALLFRAIQEEGRLVSEALFSYLKEFSPDVADKFDTLLPRLGQGGGAIKVLFRPSDTTDKEGFFFVASYPPVSGDLLKAEQARLIETGLLSRISESCDYRRSLAFDFVNATGEPEVMTYLGSRSVPNGCWAVLTSLDRKRLLNFAPDRSYWQARELQIAAVIYVLMVILVLSIFAGAWVNIRRFGQVAQALRRGDSSGATFRERNSIPELDGVAAEFDAFVSALRRSEELIRQAAEDNAHALKGPLAVISQNLEPIRGELADSNSPASRSLKMIEKSILRLDALISAARRIEEATAEMMEQRMVKIDLVSLLPLLVEEYREIASDRGVRVHLSIAGNLTVWGNENLLETALENVMSNAIDFSPPEASVRISAIEESGEVQIRIDDEGPGIDVAEQELIFGRHFTTRMADGVEGNFGVGLWIVRRNIEVLGGTVHATNRPMGGLRVALSLPLA